MGCVGGLGGPFHSDPIQILAKSSARNFEGATSHAQDGASETANLDGLNSFHDEVTTVF